VDKKHRSTYKLDSTLRMRIRTVFRRGSPIAKKKKKNGFSTFSKPELQKK
jgi:hypothetical protein